MLASVLALLGVFSVSACTSGGGSQADLASRAQAYMDMRQQGSWEAIWDGMIDPQAREQIKEEIYLERRRSSFDIVDFEIISIDEQGDEGRVVAKLDAIVSVLKPGGGLMRIPREVDDAQQWVLRDGRWYIQLQG